ncbi:MAG: AzlD domain-containing protein [Fusobacteriaceae bacterium]|jgi:branched-subunit amino acid transport protein AzlD|nr:AzlD domain-containing protein [Fusobacteriaceae bacterium]
MNDLKVWYILSMVSIAGIVTFVIRAFPFIVMSKKNESMEKYMMYLSKVLPPAIVGVLIIYSLKDTKFLVPSNVIPKLLALIVVILLQLWKKNSLISIFAGTVLYMFLVQKIFI